MKKIVGILGMAAVLASGAFAAEPAPNYVLAEFTGDASFGWKADFADTEKVKMGMYNAATTNLKFGFVSAGDKTTAGDGIWGELKIKLADPIEWDAGSPTMVEPAIDTAKIHFVDGDFSAALNIAKPSIKIGGFAPTTATPIQGTLVNKAGKDWYADARKSLDDAKKDMEEAKADYDKAADSNKNAKYVAWKDAEAVYNALKAKYADMPAKPADSNAALATAEIGDETGLSAGFGLELKMDKIAALNFKLMDNAFEPTTGTFSYANDKKFGMAIEAELLAVENLIANVKTTFNIDTKYTGLQANLGYNFAIDDKLYVKPAAAYQMVKVGDTDAKNALAASVMFGWGAKEVKPAIDYLQNADGDQIFNEGVSVAVCPIISADNTNFLMSVGLYDQSLFSFLGLEDFGVLKTAFAFDTYLDSKAAKNNVSKITAAVAYDVTFSPIYVSVHAGMQGGLKGENAKFEPAFKFGAKLGSTEVIDNTDVFVGFEAEGAANKDKLEKAEVTVGTKIHF